MSTLYRSPGYPCPASVSSDYRVSQGLLEFPRMKGVDVASKIRAKQELGVSADPPTLDGSISIPSNASWEPLRIGLSSSTIHDPTDRQKGGRHVEPRGAVTPCSCYTGRFPDPSPLTPRGPKVAVSPCFYQASRPQSAILYRPLLSHIEKFSSLQMGAVELSCKWFPYLLLDMNRAQVALT
jgi:hypothetical protein